MRNISVRDEYSSRFGRQTLTLWSGAFASDLEGWATELPHHDGYMVTMRDGTRVRVECPAPRTDDNYVETDAALTAAIGGAP